MSGRKGKPMERGEGSPVHIRNSGFLAAALLVRESRRLLLEHDQVSMGALQQERRVGVRHLAGQWEPKHE